MNGHRLVTVPAAEPALQKLLAAETGISILLAQLLINRRIRTPQDAEKFLRPRLEDLHGPHLFTAMPKAVRRLHQAKERREKVMVFGDYDVDGVTAVALLSNTFRRMGLSVTHYLPHRLREGYGLNSEGVAAAIQQQVRLLVTVDCGISNHKEVEALGASGIDVIITDHHQASEAALPKAVAILNPKLDDSGYPYRELAGVGVAYKLAQAVSGQQLSDELDLVALGTIADVAALTGENRILVKEGLAHLAKTKKVGLQALIESARINNRRFSSFTVSYILGPRLNAAGRLDTAETSLALLLATEESAARQLAGTIEAHNRQRQKLEGRILEEAHDLIAQEVDFGEQRVIVVAKENWHQGVLGVVASKLADRFGRPALVIALNEGLCKGSGRSIKNFHLFEALCECRQHLASFGGHQHAVGLVIAAGQIAHFRQAINRLADEKLRIEDLLPRVEVDLELDFSQINEELVGDSALLEPFGAGNPEPLFYTRGLKLASQPQVLARDTLKFLATDGAITHQVIGFGLAGLRQSLEEAESFELIYRPRIDDWQGQQGLILEAGDILVKMNPVPVAAH